jgi:hypothetical protein
MKNQMNFILAIAIMIYMLIGIFYSIYLNFELISEKGIIAFLFRGDEIGILQIIFWPFYLF